MIRRIVAVLGTTALVLNMLMLAGIAGALFAAPVKAQDAGDTTKIVSALAQLNEQTGKVLQSLTGLGAQTDKSVQSLASVDKSLASVDKSTSAIDQRLRMRLVTAVGYAEVKAEPDVATAQLEVKTEAPVLEQAMAQNKAQVAGLRGQLKGIGVADKDVQLADPTIAPVLGDKREIKGYRVVSPVLVSVLKPKDAGAKLLEQVVKLGGSNFKEIKFSLADPKAMQAKAREQAIADARAKAEQYAKVAGGTLGVIQEISEDVQSKTIKIPPAPGEPSAQLFTAEVKIVFELK